MSDIENLFLRLKALNVSLWLDEASGELRFKAPKGALSDALRADLKTSKEDIRRFLAAASGQRQGAETPIAAAPRDGGLPLSFAQQRLWFLYRMEGKSAAYNIPACRRVLGPLDAVLLERALNEVVRRHEVLRTRFAVQGDEAVQVVLPALRIEVPLIDFASLGEEEKQLAASRHVALETGHAFDLENEALLRLSLVRLAPQEHVLVLAMHHIVSDGWSLEIFIRELTTAYRALAAGSTVELQPLAVQYGDFAVWQRRWFAAGGMAAQFDYWKRQLAGVPQLLELPADRPRPPAQSYRGGVEFFSLDGALKIRLEALCRAENASLFMGLDAAFACLIHRYTGREDIVTGTHTAGRTRREQEGLIGFFINTLPLRVDLSGAPSFREVLRRVGRVALDAFSNQDVPFEKLVELVQPERNMSHVPLVQVMCVLQNMPVGKSELAGLTVETIPLARDTSKFDLSLLLEEATGRIDGELEFNGDIFDRERIRRMAGHYAALLERMVAAPDAPIGSLPLLSAAETAQIVGDFSLPERIWPPLAGDADIVGAFARQVARRGEGTALCHAGNTLSYRELDERSNRLARQLLACGLQAEGVVALCLENSPELIVAMLAILKAGGAYLPVEPDTPAQRLAFLLRDAGAALTVTRAGLAGQFGEVGLVLIDEHAGEIAARDGVPPEAAIAPHGLAYVIYTSGSTGTPKGVMIEHRSVVNLVDGLAAQVYRGETRPLRVALMAATVFDASVQQIFGALLQGHALYLIDKAWKQDGARLIRFLCEEGIEVCDGTPTLLSVLAEAGLEKARAAGLQRLVIGGEALPRDLAQRVAALGIAVSNVYGPTECCVDATVCEVMDGGETQGGIVPIGRPLGRCRAYILDPHGLPVPIGVDGELTLSGAGLFRGYVNRPELTAERRLPNPFAAGDREYAFLYRTGDVCRWLPDGQIAFLGRNDDQVKIRGYRIELGEIEAQLAAHPLVREAAVLARDNAGGGRELAAWLTASGDLDAAALHGWLKGRVPQYMVPAAFYLLEDMPLNKSGKIDRKALPSSGAARAAASRVEARIAPRDERERLLCGLFAAILNVPEVGIRDNFFFLGGDSIKALQLAARLNRANWAMEIRDLFLHPTVEELAPTLRAVKCAPAVRSEFTGQVPLTAVQRWFFETYGGGVRVESGGAAICAGETGAAALGFHFNQSVLLKATAPVDAAALKAALGAVVARHDALRLHFRMGDEGVIQEYREPEIGFEVADCAAGADPHAFLLERSGALQRRVRADGATVQAGLYRLPDGERLFIAIHHLVVDAVSWRVLFDDLDAAYRQATAGRSPVLPPAPTAFGDWAQGLQGHADRQALAQLDYWLGVEAAEQPADFPGGACTHGDCATLTVRLTPALTALLTGAAHEAYNTGIDDLLLCGLARALANWRGRARTLAMLEGHGREAALGEAGTTVGWFTSLYPVVLAADGDEEPGCQIKRIKEELRAIPDKGVGYGILRYLADPSSLGGRELRAAPQIGFNYLGRFERALGGGAFVLSDEETGPNIDPAAPQPFPLEIVGMLLDDTLEFTAGYDTRHFCAESVAQLLDIYRAELAYLADYAAGRDCRELTPSDIDYRGFDQAALDAFVDSLAGVA